MHNRSKAVHQKGFTLVELSVVLVIISLLTAGGLAVGSSMVERAAYIDTAKLLDQLDESLKNYYVVNGKLPCPAAINTAQDNANFGVSVANCRTAGAITGTQSNGGVRSGMIPVRTLGLSSKAASDKFGSRIIYAVTEDMTDTATFGSATGKVDIYGASDVTPTQTGMAYVLFSNGRDRKGAFAYSTGAQVSTCSPTTTRDAMNCVYTNLPKFRDAPFNNGDQASLFFDDVIRWAPKYQFMAMDTDTTNLWAKRADNDNVYSVGADGLIANTNVGIGTDNPAEKLDISGSLQTTSGFLGSKAYGTDYIEFAHRNYKGSTTQYALLQNGVNGNTYLNSAVDGSLFFRNDNATQMVIRGTDGHTGIGPSGVRADAMLTVTGGPIYTGNMWLGKSGDTTVAPDIQADAAILIAADDNIYLNYNANGENNNNFYILSGTMTANNVATYKKMQLTPSGVMTVYGSGGTCSLGNDTNPSCTSDQRYKTDIIPVGDALNKLLQIHGVYYHWNDASPYPDKKTLHLGVIAQDVQKVFPEAVTEDENGYYMVSMGNLVAPLIESVRELNDKNTALKKENAALKSDIRSIQKRLDALESRDARAPEETAMRVSNPKGKPHVDFRMIALMLAIVAGGLFLWRRRG